jgi:hypothetical protein
MGEGKTMKECPICSKEVPAVWSVCEFCGNVFSKQEGGPEVPGMLFWGEGSKVDKG